MESTLYHTAHSIQYDILRVSDPDTPDPHHAYISTCFDSTTMGPSHDCDIVFSTDFRKVSSDCTRLGAASSKAPTLPLLSRAHASEGGERGVGASGMIHDRLCEARGWVG